jgi:hypothetical protein
MKIVNFVINFIIYITIIELIFSVIRNILRFVIYRYAKYRANILNKKLLVIGDPDAGIINKIFGRVYHCGDLCLDLNGCNCKKSIKFDLNNINNIDKIINLDNYVVFESCVLEFTKDPHKIIKYITDKTELYQVRINPSFIFNLKPFFEIRRNFFYKNK